MPLKAELLLAAGRHSIATTMLRTALRRARPASSAAPRRGIASGLNLLQLSTSDLQPARTWDAAEADGADAASGGASSPPSQLFWPTYDGVPPAAPAAAESTTRAARRLHRHVPPPALRGEEGRPLRTARRLHGRLREGPRAVLRETRKLAANHVTSIIGEGIVVSTSLHTNALAQEGSYTNLSVGILSEALPDASVVRFNDLTNTERFEVSFRNWAELDNSPTTISLDPGLEGDVLAVSCAEGFTLDGQADGPTSFNLTCELKDGVLQWVQNHSACYFIGTELPT